MDPVLESVTLEPELEEALANASDAELCDIAGKAVTCELGVENRVKLSLSAALLVFYLIILS